MRDLLLKKVQAKRSLVSIGQDYPLALAKLWIPHCHRWKGLGSKSERPRGCGRPMSRLNGDTWVCNHCHIKERRTSQRDPLQRLGREATLIAGGNRAGKTQIGAMMAVAVAASKKEWWVREWIAQNNIDPSIIPDEPCTVWASALSFSDALEYVRPKIAQYCPKGSRFVRWKAQDRGQVYFPNGGRIASLSADAGRSKFQGSGGIGMVWLDEEQPYQIFEECMLRVVDSRGILLLTMTPLKGMTWVYDLFVEGKKDGFETHTISGLDNPWISSVKLARAVQHMSTEAQQSRLFGAFTNQQGLVYSEVSPHIHIINSFVPPEDWPRYRSIDFGTRNPFACLWFAHDRDDDVLHVYREYYKTEATTLENGRRVNMMSANDPPVEWTVADPESRDGRLLLARECNIPTKPAHKAVLDGINSVKERLSLDANGKPHLLIYDNCKELIREFRLYRWSEGAGKDRPIKKWDHGLDALRYQTVLLQKYMRHL